MWSVRNLMRLLLKAIHDPHPLLVFLVLCEVAVLAVCVGRHVCMASGGEDSVAGLLLGR